jgi:hypothetical protein
MNVRPNQDTLPQKMPIRTKKGLFRAKNVNNNYTLVECPPLQTTITLEEFNGGQRLLRRLLLQNGYWFRPFDIIKARNGDYIMLARYNDFLISGNAPDKPMLTRVDSAGQFMVFSENLVEVPLKVWPNPVHGRILRMELPEGPPCQVALLDVQGRSRWVGTRSTQDSQLDLSDTPSGIYFLRITQPGQPPRVTKVVLP